MKVHITWAMVPMIFAVLLGLNLVYGWYKPSSWIQKPDKQFVEVEKIKVVEKIPKGWIQPKDCKVEVIEKTKLVTVYKDKLPDWFKLDPNKQMTAMGTVPPYRGDTQVGAIFDVQTGKTDLIQKKMPIPLFGLPRSGDIGARLGIGGVDLYGRYDVFRVMNFYIGGYAELNVNSNAQFNPSGNGNTNTKLMLDIHYPF